MILIQSAVSIMPVLSRALFTLACDDKDRNAVSSSDISRLKTNTGNPFRRENRLEDERRFSHRRTRTDDKHLAGLISLCHVVERNQPGWNATQRFLRGELYRASIFFNVL